MQAEARGRLATRRLPGVVDAAASGDAEAVELHAIADAGAVNTRGWYVNPRCTAAHVLAALLLTMAAMLTMLRCVVLRLLSPHPLVCRYGVTALIFAASGGHESTVRLLVESRADLTARNCGLICARTFVPLAAAYARGFRGYTAWAAAMFKNHRHISAVLESAGAAK